MRVLLAAEVAIESEIELTNAGEIIIPEEPRRKAERSIELLANLMAILESCKRQVFSPLISVALISDSGQDRQFLEKARGIHSSRVSSRSFDGIKPRFDSELSLIPKFLNDRLDGLALLAEALSHDHATGKFHEFVRFFERAFTCGPFELIQPVSEFLLGADQGYTQDEIEKWFTHLRHPLTHADRKSTFLLEADARPVIWRLQQAAYDVLFNKAVWRSKSVLRRKAWSPPAWVDPGIQRYVVQEGKQSGRDFWPVLEVLDRFGVFPSNSEATIQDLLPTEWWWPKFNPQDRKNSIK